MAVTDKKQGSIIPDMPRDNQVVDMKTGRMTAHWQLYHQQLNLALQSSIQKEGMQMPKQSTTDISNIKNNQNLIGNVIHNETTGDWVGIRVLTPATATDPPVTQQVKFNVTVI